MGLDSVTQLVNGIVSGAPIYRFAYQPTFMPHLNLAVCIKELSAMASDNCGIAIWLVVDFDTSEHVRFRRADLPMPESDKVSYLRLGVSSDDRTARRCDIRSDQCPGALTIQGDWLQYLRNTHQVRGASPLPPSMLPGRFHSVSDAMVQDLVRFAKWTGAGDFLVCRLSRIARASPLRYHELGAAVEELGYAEHASWHKCSGCGIKRDYSHTRKVAWCACCQRRFTEVPANMLIPKVILDDLLDFEIGPVAGGVTYRSGVPHMRKALDAYASLATKPIAEFICEVSDVALAAYSRATGASSELIKSGRAALPFWTLIASVADSVKIDVGNWTKTAMLKHGQ
jgi:hypothetical protein